MPGHTVHVASREVGEVIYGEVIYIDNPETRRSN